MSDESQLLREVERASKARAVMESVIVKEALETIERDTLALWEQTGSRDTDARERLWMFYVVSRKFRNTLQQVMETGRMAELQLQEKRNGLSGILKRFA